MFEAVAGPRSFPNISLNTLSANEIIPLPTRLPPNPPDPLTKIVEIASKISSPEYLSFVVTRVVTAAAFPLSRACKILQDYSDAYMNYSGDIGDIT